MTQSTPPSSWTETTIRGCLADEFPGAWGSEPGRSGPNAHILRSTNLDDDGHINFATAAKRWIDEPHLTQRRLRDGDVLLETSGGGPGKPVGRVAHFQAPDSIAYLSSNFFRTLRPDERKVDSRFLAWRLLDLYRQPRIWNFQQQTTGIINLKTKDYLEQRFHLPEKPEQVGIAAVLDTVDEAIAKTSAVVAKLRQVRAGLLHDLLTRGLDHNGELRDPVAHPEQFQPSSLGQIPKQWELATLVSRITLPQGQVDPRVQPYCDWTLVAPDHIESETGRLLGSQTARQQDAISGKYVFQPGDVIYSKIRPYLRKAVLANERGLCSADMYPLRPNARVNSRFLLAAVLGEAFSRFASAVSMRSGFPKINREELAGFKMGWPDSEEQNQIAAVLLALDDEQMAVERELSKLGQLKSGLMADLLTGRVRMPETTEVAG